MKIQVVNGPFIGYTPFIFPDGQRHITLEGDVTFSEVVITASLCSADDLFDLLLVNDILCHNHNGVHLQVEYLLGGRMDRRINDRQPNTLAVVASIINAAEFKSVRILDPHSEVALDIIAYMEPAMYAMTEFLTALNDFRVEDTVIIQPDKGAETRVGRMTRGLGFMVTSCSKERDEVTGKLSGFKVNNPGDVYGKRCLIVDDICDGGGTFIGLAKVLRAAGATSVNLFVTHGIFSKGRDLEGIDKVYSTDSFTGKVWPKGGTRTDDDWCTCMWGGQPRDGIHRENCAKA